MLPPGGAARCSFAGRYSAASERETLHWLLPRLERIECREIMAVFVDV